MTELICGTVGCFVDEWCENVGDQAARQIAANLGMISLGEYEPELFRQMVIDGSVEGLGDTVMQYMVPYPDFRPEDGLETYGSAESLQAHAAEVMQKAMKEHGQVRGPSYGHIALARERIALVQSVRESAAACKSSNVLSCQIDHELSVRMYSLEAMKQAWVDAVVSNLPSQPPGGYAH